MNHDLWIGVDSELKRLQKEALDDALRNAALSTEAKVDDGYSVAAVQAMNRYRKLGDMRNKLARDFINSHP